MLWKNGSGDSDSDDDDDDEAEYNGNNAIFNKKISEYGNIAMIRKIVVIVFVIIIFQPCLTFAKCLQDYPDIVHHRFFHYRNKTRVLTIESSDRVTHATVSNIFQIFLQEVLGYNDVKIVFHKQDEYFFYNFNKNMSVVDRIAEPLNEFGERMDPEVTINLEVLLPSDFSIKRAYHSHIHDAGNIAPPGRFGWFVWSKSTSLQLNWTLFQNVSFAERYSLPSAFKKIMDVADINIYTPMKCKNITTSCALLLAPDYDSTKDVIPLIEALNVYVQVAWLGRSKLIEVIEELITQELDVLILYWIPSELNQKRICCWQPVNFPPCNSYNMRNVSINSFPCVYDTRRLVKLVSDTVRIGAHAAFEAVHDVEFTQEDYTEFIEESVEKSHYQVACDWLIKRQHMRDSNWHQWMPVLEDRPSITIAGLFPMSGPMAQSTAGAAAAAQMAVDDVNKNTSVLPHHQLKMIVHDGGCNVDTVMKRFIEYVPEKRHHHLVGVLGPACSDTVEPLIGITKYFRTLVISYSAEGSFISDRNKYPYFFRTIGGNQDFMYVYLTIFKTWNWKRIAALSEEAQKTAEYLTLLQEMVEERSMTFLIHRKIPRQRGIVNTSTIQYYLQDLQDKHARIIIADLHETTARSVLCEAYHLNMTAQHGYVWFLPHWLSANWYDGDLNCTTSQMEKAIKGHFRLTHRAFPPDEDLTEIGGQSVGTWKAEYRKQLELSHGKLLWSSYAGYAYDAVWTYALALDQLFRINESFLIDIHSVDSTTKFVQLIGQTNFSGISGRVLFDRTGSRKVEMLIQQWTNNQYVTIATSFGSEEHGLDLKKDVVQWYTDDGQVPNDGAPPPHCYAQSVADYFNISCTAALVIYNSPYVIAFVIAGILYALWSRYRYKRKMRKYELTQQYMKSMGFDLVSTNMVQKDKWEIPRNHVVINRKLGEGAFGTVFGGEALFEDTGWCAVAVKTLKANAGTEQKLAFLSEAEVMKSFNHPNLVKLLGMCTHDVPVYTVIEFMLYGDLKTFLLNRRGHLLASCRNNYIFNNPSDEIADGISPKKLTSFAIDIARGLSYLNSIKYVHRDLACRNIMISSRRVAKIGDFGLTRPIHENDYYRFTRKGMMPIRWMAPESLCDGIFNHSSDIWSYGVVLWEIITFGSYPWKGLANAQVMEKVKQGFTLESPKGIKLQLDSLLRMCWKFESRKRPTAQWIVEYLSFNSRCLTPCLDFPNEPKVIQSAISHTCLNDTDDNDQLFAMSPNEDDELRRLLFIDHHLNRIEPIDIEQQREQQLRLESLSSADTAITNSSLWADHSCTGSEGYHSGIISNHGDQ